MAIRARALDAIVVATAIAMVTLAARRTCAHAGELVLGVAVGMSAAELRAAFAPGARGRFRADARSTGTSVQWHADAPMPRAPIAAELELHEGRLARIRLTFGEAAERPDALRLLGARALEPATWSRDRGGRLVATWDARCDGEAR